MKPLEPLEVPLDGVHLIEASAGTGKTYTITTLFLRLLIERRLEVRQILVVTFTRAATAELRDRIRRRLAAALRRFDERALDETGGAPSGDEVIEGLLARSVARGALDDDRARLRDAVRGFDEAAVFTIHGFCQRVLRDRAFESGQPFAVELVKDEGLLARDIAADFWTNAMYDADPVVVEGVGKKALPADLAELHARVGAATRLLPEAEALRASLEPLCAARDAAFESAARMWRDEREAIVRELTVDGRLKKNEYDPGKIQREWAPSFDMYFAKSPPGAAPDKLEKLRPETLLSGTKKAHADQPPTHDFFGRCAALLDADEALDEALAQVLVGFERGAVEHIRRELRRRHAAANTQSYDALLERVREALAGEGGERLAAQLRADYPAALIDEFQDTDPVQYASFKRIYIDAVEEAQGGDASSRPALFLIGDPKQAIYSFRGADIFAYLSAAKVIGGERGHTLGRSYRSDGALIAALNTLFSAADRPFLLDEIEYRPVDTACAHARLVADTGSGVEWLFISSAEPDADGASKRKSKRNNDVGEDVPARVAAEIVGLLRSGATIEVRLGETRRVEARDVAVLCRSNEQAAKTQDALRALGVPSVVESAASVFDSATAADLERVLEAVRAPASVGGVRAALATPLVGLDARAVAALDEDEQGWEAWVDRFTRCRDTVERGRNLTAALRTLFDACDTEAQLVRRPDGERRATDLRHLVELLQQVATAERLGLDGLVHWLGLMRSPATREALGGDEVDAAQLRLESDRDAVRLATVHKSKGLEYPIVYCPFLRSDAALRNSDKAHPRFHDPRADGALTVQLDPASDPDAVALATREALAEELRLLYVALTRAKHRVSVVWGASKGAEGSALGYLLHQGGAGGGDGGAVAVRARIKDELDDGAMRAELEALCARAASAGGTMWVRELAAATTERWSRSDAAPVLSVRAATRRFDEARRTSSFSGLIERADRDGAGARAELPDNEEHAELPSPVAMSAAGAGGPTVRLADFPAGPRPGNLLHEVFEQIDFTRADPAELPDTVAATLRRYDFSAAHAAALTDAIDAVLETGLPVGRGEVVRLCDVPRSARMSELEFMLPVGDGDRGDGSSFGSGGGGNGGGAISGEALRPAELARVLEAQGAPKASPTYARSLAALGFTPLRGFLRGFVDLVFEHGGRWYVVDYKSNFLGMHAADYGQTALADAMAHHDYYLQAYLYTVAVQRYLRMRVPGYTYASFGGVLYLFVRGIAPAHDRGTGVYFERPSEALVEALDDAVAGRSPQAGPGGAR